MSNLFRKKSLERISSPEQLNAYIRVSTPSVWILLTAVVVLLTGVCVWGIWGRLDTVMPAVAVCREGTVTAYVRQADAEKIPADAKLTVAGMEGRIISAETEPVLVDGSFTEYMRHVGGLQEGEWVRALRLDAECAEGVHAVQIVIESVSPMSFVLN